MFKLVFSGELITGFERETVVANLARLLKKDKDTVRGKLFGGQSVVVKKVPAREQALKWRKAFAEAGAVLLVLKQADGDSAGRASADQSAPTSSQPDNTEPPAADIDDPSATSYEEPTPASEAARSQGVRKRNKVYVLLMLIVFAVIAAVILVLWSTRPLWQGIELEQSQQDLGAVLYADDAFLMARLDVERAGALERLAGEPADLGALPGDSDGLMDSLARAGIDVRRQVSSLWASAYVSGEQASGSLLLSGQFDAAVVKDWFAQRYGLDQSLDDGLIFHTVDNDNCRKSEPRRAYITDTLIIVGAEPRVAAALEQLRGTDKQPLAPALARWYRVSEGQLGSVALFAPENLGRSVGGIQGMILGSLGQAASPAQALYIGAEPVAMPPGLEVSALVASDNNEFLDEAEAAVRQKLAQLRDAAAESVPDAVEIYDRLSVSRTERGLQAAVRFDQKLRQDLEQWVTSMFSVSMGGDAQTAQVEERIDDNPPVYGSVAAGELTPYNRQSTEHEPFFKPTVFAGPFALAVESLAVDAEQRIAVELKAQALDLPNLPARGRAASLVIDDLLDRDGNSLLATVECGPDENAEPGDLGNVSSYNYYVDGESVSGTKVTGEKTLTLQSGVGLDEIGQLKGHFHYPLIKQVEKIQLQQPLAGQLVERDGFKLRFMKGGEHGLKYRYSGEVDKLLNVIAYNADGQPLASGGAMWGAALLGAGKTANVDFHGDIHSVEVVLATEVSDKRYPFATTEVVPEPEPLAHPQAVPDWQQSGDWQALIDSEPPEVSYDWSQPTREMALGPVRLAVMEASVDNTWGLSLQAQAYVTNAQPVDALLAGASLSIDNLPAGAGDGQPVAVRQFASFAPVGGYIMNGVYRPDEDRPWMRADLNLRNRDLKPEGVDTLEATLTLNLPLQVSVESAAFELGTAVSYEGFSATPSELTSDTLYLDYSGDIAPLVNVIAYREGEPVSEPAVIEEQFGEARIALTIGAVPDRLDFAVAQRLRRESYPLTLPVGE